MCITIAINIAYYSVTLFVWLKIGYFILTSNEMSDWLSSILITILPMLSVPLSDLENSIKMMLAY